MASVAPLPTAAQWAPGSVNVPLAHWPATMRDTTIDPEPIATRIMAALNARLQRWDEVGVAALFAADGYWRDHLALTWDLRTVKGRSKIAAFLGRGGHHLVRIEVDRSAPDKGPRVASFNPLDTVKGIRFFTVVTTQHGSGRGLVTLVEDGDGEADGGGAGGAWKIWTCFTMVDELRGFEEPLGARRAQGTQHGAAATGAEQQQKKNWLDRRKEEVEFANGSPDVLVIGAGQAGLTMHARLKMLGVPTLVVEAHAAVGDNWRRRYRHLVLHDPVHYDQMPYLGFPDWWPRYTPKDKLAGFLATYAELLELNVWTSATVAGPPRWDGARERWDVEVRRSRPGDDEEGGEGDVVETRILHPKHIVQATGHSGPKNLPPLPGYANFRGDRLCHSAEFAGVRPGGGGGGGKKAVVVGSCNSAMDIAQAFHEEGYAVTLVQRSSTAVAGVDTVAELLLGGLYREGGPALEDADLQVWGWPAEVFKASARQLTGLQRTRDAALHTGLERAGFRLDHGPDGCGIFLKYFQRGGGYYFDVGAARLIADGRVRVRQGREVAEILPHGLRLSDGEELDADEIVIATGYQNMRIATRQIFGDEVADRVGDVWGFDAEGEMRTIWRPSGHPGLWIHGGNLACCRYFSRILALQIKAQLEGISP